MNNTDWETVVGLEVHVQLKTHTKLFSPARVRFGQPANVDVDAVDTGLPGALPVLNAHAVELAVKVGLALGSTIDQKSVFARKHYFYPDLPKGYQISQHDQPILRGGALSIVVDDATGAARSIPLTRAHLEEDAGKSAHGARSTRLDYNRAGTPLLEIVTEPALSSADEAMRFFRALRALVMAVGACDGNLQEGSMRADANVSVRKRGAPLGTRVELKNINSPRFLHDAVVYESRRQIGMLLRGEVIRQETRLWDSARGESRAMRSKEDAPDYRYFPDPDLPVVVVTDAQIAAARAALPELPAERRARYIEKGVAAKDAAALVDDAALAAFFDDACAAAAGHDKAVANWVKNEVMGLLAAADDDEDVDAVEDAAEDVEDVDDVERNKATRVSSPGATTPPSPRVRGERFLPQGGDAEATRVSSPRAHRFGRLTPQALGALVGLVERGEVAGKAGKELVRVLFDDGGDAAAVSALVDARGLRLARGKDVDDAVAAVIAAVFAANPVQVEQVRAGKDKVKGFLVGQVLAGLKKAGQAAAADPKRVGELVDAALAQGAAT